jgi:hypothetical protein
MSRHPDPGFDPRIADWLEADPDHAPPEVLRTVESALPSIQQRRALRLPWRNLPMNRPVLIAATVGLLAMLGIGAFTVGSRPSTTTPTMAPTTAPAVVEASASPAVTGVAYATARDAICEAASTKAEPIKARLPPLYEPGSTDAQRSDAIAAIREYLVLADGFVAELAALDVPPELVAEHAASVANYRDVLILIRESLGHHDEGRTAEAIAVDLATDGISAQITSFEQQHGLAGCP